MSKEPCSPNKAYHGYCVTQVPANRYPSHAGTRLCNTRGYYYRVRHLKVYDGYYPGKQCILPGYPPIIPADPGKPSCQNDGYPLPAGIYPCYALNTGEYPRVRVPVGFSKAITRTQRVFRHGYPSPAGDTTGYPRAQVPAGESGYHYQYPWYPWYPVVLVQSHMSVATIVSILSHRVCYYVNIL